MRADELADLAAEIAHVEGLDHLDATLVAADLLASGDLDQALNADEHERQIAIVEAHVFAARWDEYGRRAGNPWREL